jgi:hypothetical protein
MDDSLTEHRAILAAIRLRDADRAAALTADHIRVPAQRLQAALREGGLEQASGRKRPGTSRAGCIAETLDVPVRPAGSRDW